MKFGLNAIKAGCLKPHKRGVMVFLSLSGAVLAGGKGERMASQDKGLLLFRGEVMALSVGLALRQVTDCVFINANRNSERYADLGFEVIADDHFYQDKGPLSGLAACLTFAKTSHLLVSPCDTPCISGDAFTKLIIASNAFPDRIHYLSDAFGSHPLHAILPVEPALIILKDFLDKSERHSVMAFYEVFGCESVLWDKSEELLNVNTPDALS
jgi:molybdopterin-guanine dinucleotide biosynthesis protein A